MGYFEHDHCNELNITKLFLSQTIVSDVLL